jgi:hypothetical protein
MRSLRSRPVHGVEYVTNARSIASVKLEPEKPPVLKLLCRSGYGTLRKSCSRYCSWVRCSHMRSWRISSHA